jgi:hypothetical protein
VAAGWGVEGVLKSVKDRRAEAMLAMFSDTGTSEVRGVLAAKMTRWTRLGSLVLGIGRVICGGCSAMGWTLRIKRPWGSLCWVLEGMRGVAKGNQGQ